MIEALIAFAAMLALAFARLPIAFAMGLVGFAGFAFKTSVPAALAMAGAVTYETGLSYALSIVPLFVLMGNLVTRAGMSQELFRAAYVFIGHLRVVSLNASPRGCGSSIATAATMAKVAVPPMRRFGYSDALASGSVAAGGTLGILIPPSVVLVIYGILTQQNIGKLFIAGVLPGLLAIACYIGAVRFTVALDPKAGPPGPRRSGAERLAALKRVWGVVALFVLVLGGIYGGVFTPTEAAGIGAAGGFVFANMTSMPGELIAASEKLAVFPILVIIAICVIYVLLGCVLESMSMILLTVPIFYPVVQHLGFDLIWFGIVIVVVRTG